ncbi:MAG: hypothetical protein ABI321_20105 [Polyangia bacterium]
MRKTLLLAVTLLAAPLYFAACGGSSSNKTEDMAVTGGDMAAHTGDMAEIAHGDNACTTILFTAQKCSGNDVTACVTAAVESGTIMAQNEFQALLSCGYTQCIGKTFDGGTEDGGITGCTDAKDVTSGCTDCVSYEATHGCPAEFQACVNGT